MTLKLHVLFYLLFINFSAIGQNKLLSDTFDLYHGIKLEDPYRNLENLKDSTVIDWLNQQEQQTKRVLNNILGRSKLIDLQNQLGNTDNDEVKQLKITNNNQLFYLKRSIGEEVYKLYYRGDSLEGEEELLYNPKDFLPKTNQNYYINYLKPSWDGKKLVVGFSKDGEEFSEMRIFDMKSKKFLPISINKCIPNAVGVYWLPDNSGITYLRIPNADNKSKEIYLNTESILHKLDAPPRVIFSKSNNPEIKMNPADLPAAFVDNNTNKYILGVITGATPYDDAYYISASQINEDKQIWKPLFKKSDQLSLFFQDQDSLVYMTSKNASNFKICKTSILNPDLESPVTLIEEKKDEVIQSFRLVKDGIVYTTTKNGVEAKLYLQTHKGVDEEVSLPFAAGAIELRAKSKEDPYLEIRAKGWLHREQRYTYNFKNQEFTEANLSKNKSSTITKDLIIKEILVPSHDGEEVPLSLIYKEDIKRDGTTPVFMIGYGAYGLPIKPVFSEKIISWALEGGIFAVAHVRGGGEKGDSWYKGGYKATKPNSWKDLIACTEYLIKKKYTSVKKIAIHGGSAGGITVGRAMTERPDLFGAVIVSVGKMNTVRSEFGYNGENNVKEYGTVKDPEEFKGLLEMDSYHHIQKGVAYPATLVITGMNDARVPPWHSTKFAARLQDATSSDNPVLLDIDFESGHSTANSRKKRLNSVADVLAFAFWQTGHPDYQPK